MRDTGFSLTAKLAASCERAEPDPGPEPGIAYFNDEAYIQTARTVLETAPEDGIWVFAYGSLLWRPAFAPHETRVAHVSGWRREFCLEISRWRGSPQQPGLMMALRKGGFCRGLALRLSP